MKSKTPITAFGNLAALLSLAVIVAGCASSGLRVTEERKFIQLHHVANTGEDLHLKKGDAVAMVCTNCKTVLYADLHKPYSRFVTPFEHRHYCPGCKSTITMTGVGFGAKEEVKHTCDACGSDSLFCCASKSGESPTAGMGQAK
jgi:Zn finger protein HypA/HybF involved in hydrogenase expression